MIAQLKSKAPSSNFDPRQWLWVDVESTGGDLEESLKLGRYRALTSHLRGKTPGPEGSFGKLAASDLNLRVVMFANELLGVMAVVEDGSDSAAGLWMERLLNARELTIAGGASEIQHNIIGERVLGLPKS